MDNTETTVGLLGLMLAGLGIWMNWQEAVATALVAHHKPDFIFTPSIAAIILGLFVLISGYRRGMTRGGLWLALPTILISLVAIIFAVMVRNSSS